jgi:biotin carboxylase
MAYLIIDPCGQYPSYFMEFLGGLGRGAVAVFSSRARLMLWRDKWSQQLGQYVLDEYLASSAPSLAQLAALIAHEWPALDGVIPWDEESILLGAALGERLNLGWNSLEVIERCRDKAVMKAWLREHGSVRINASEVVTDSHGALEFQRRLGAWPVVVKPTSGSGSENVYFPTHKDELLQRCQEVLESGEGEVLLEEYLGGQEIAVNGIVDGGGDLLVTDVWAYDRRTSHGIPNLYYQTVKVSTQHPMFSTAGQYAAAVVKALGLRRAPIHMELKVDDRGPCLIEVGARLSGGNLPVLASKVHGRSLFELAACHYLENLPLRGDDIDTSRYDGFEARVVHGLQAVEVSRIRVVHGVKEVTALPSFDGFALLRPVGTRAPVSRDLDTTAYEVNLIHSDPRQIARDAKRVRQLLRYE